MKKVLLILLCSMVFAVPTAIQMDFLMSGIMDTTAKPLAGGTVYFYVNDGGTTPKAAYTGPRVISGNILTSPLTLNDSGVPSQTPYGYGVYRIVVKNRAGVTKYTYTNISYGVIGSQSGIVDVKETYGVNDTAINNAIADVGSSNTILLFTPGEYTIGNTKTFPSNITLEFQPGAYFYVANAVTCIVSGSIIAESQRIKTGPGTFIVSSINNPIQYSRWDNSDLSSINFKENINIKKESYNDLQPYFLGIATQITINPGASNADIQYNNTAEYTSSNFSFDPVEGRVTILIPGVYALSCTLFGFMGAAVTGDVVVLQGFPLTTGLNENQRAFDTKYTTDPPAYSSTVSLAYIKKLNVGQKIDFIIYNRTSTTFGQGSFYLNIYKLI